MEQKNATGQGWNLFALELQRILRKYGMDLGQLDDRVGIHREKVRRLIQSLDTPPSLPLLNPEETEAIIGKLNLDPEDVLRLHAAVLATSVQRILSDRIRLDEAYLAAEQILPIIAQSLLAHAGEKGLGNIRAGDIDPMDSDLDDVLDTILNAIDRGSEALQWSYYARSSRERLKKARQAYNYYEEALTDLDSLGRAIRKQHAWQEWHRAAQGGLRMAQSRLDELGG
ncbi:MAG TPA: hypothetical protein VKV19_01805 [Ktedonobacteraceae bacterium]|jgi:hypothetical protein|nr:hypothetical protein [Ktedonobacteraceae bacterium]